MNMSGPSWLADIFASVMLIVAAYSAGRLVASWVWRRPIHVDVDIVHVLMGVAMAGMFVAALNPIPSGVWEVVFSAIVAWFVWRSAAYVTGRDARPHAQGHMHHVSHYPTHVVMAFAMLYMYLAPAAASGAAMSGGGGMSMGSSSGASPNYAVLPLLFLFILLAAGIWEADRAGRFRRGRKPVEPSNSLARTPELAFANVTAAASPATEATGIALAPESPAVTDGNADGKWLAPGLMAASHVAMCLAMGYMLLVML